MDLSEPLSLTSFLTSEDLDVTPKNVQDKIKNFFEKFSDEYCKGKAAGSILGEYQQKNEDLQAEIKDYELKFQSFEQNTIELRNQIECIQDERNKLIESVNVYESDLAKLRSENKKIEDDRNTLIRAAERHSVDIERLEEDIKSYQQQLKNAIKAKCDAIAQNEGVESRKVSVELKERRMEQERMMLHNQIQALSEDLNRKTAELENIRRDHIVNSMHTEAKLKEKIEELKISQQQSSQYQETIEHLNENLQDLSKKILTQKEEANKIIDSYKKELEAKTKLSNLYKNNCDDRVLEHNELAAAFSDVKRLLTEATEQYGELETTFKATNLKHDKELEEKDKTIEAKNAELVHANELLQQLKDENLDNVISKIAPSAAIASKLIRTDMSLTELYSLYVKASEELELQKRENARLDHELKTILQELSENAPAIKSQEHEYNKLIETHNILTQQRNELINEKANMVEILESANTKMNKLESENKKLQQLQVDVSRQVCYLLKEIEQLRIGLTPEHNNDHIGNLQTSNDVISRKLVTFGNIVELQDNNQKLLLIVRDLSSKLEDLENSKIIIEETEYKKKLEYYQQKVDKMQETLAQQSSMTAMLATKSERYKTMYMDLRNKQSKTDLVDVTANEESNETETKTDIKLQDVENQLSEAKDLYKSLKEQYEYFMQEKKNNDKLVNEQFDSMRKELREYSSASCKLSATVEFNKEQLKIQQKNIATYKQQISGLENRNRNYESTIIKHEQTVQLLRDELLKQQRMNANAETDIHNLNQERRLLKDANARLQTEKEGYFRENQMQNLLLNNLEMIKSNLERSEMEGKTRLENRLDDCLRELSAQRRRFQEEENRFRETINDMKRHKEVAERHLSDEKNCAEKLRTELTNVRKELLVKTNSLDDLNKKVQSSLTPSKTDNPIVAANKKAREFEVKYEQAQLEIQSLTNDLTNARKHSEQYFNMSQNAEKEIKNLHELHTAYVANAEKKIKELEISETNLKSKVTELEAEIQIAIVNDSIEKPQPDLMKKSQNELKEALEKLTEATRTLRTLRKENSEISSALNAVETKYANEMMLHSADIQELTKTKAELLKVQDQIKQLVTDRDLAKEALEELKVSHEKTTEMFNREKEELEKRTEDLNKLTSSLHDQIEALTTKMTVLSQNQSSNSFSQGNDSTLGDISMSVDDDKNCDQLLQIIKYLRKEKDLVLAKMDILKAENSRLQSEQKIMQKKVEELEITINQQKSKSETGVLSAAKHEEILRKIETMDAITDSNRILREERNSLSERVNELHKQISALEQELLPIKNENRDLISKTEELTIENTSLRTEAIRWRQRANVLVEKSNKNPEEFKRLQMERENLAKMLTSEKELFRQTVEEFNKVKEERIRFENEVNVLTKNIQTLNEEKKKLSDDFVSSKQNSTRLLQEMVELKNTLLHKESALQKTAEELESKESQLQDSKNKEIQIRKIAKRYKDSYLELSNKYAAGIDDNSTAPSSDNNETGSSGANESLPNTTDSAQNKNTIDKLNDMIRVLQDEKDKIHKDFEDLKASSEIDERTKSLLREAKARIVVLQESNDTVNNELANTKRSLEQKSEDHDNSIANIKVQYDETLSRLEKELLDQSNYHKESLAKLTRENDSLILRINQLNRQLGLQQSAKPSTSSATIIEKTCGLESSPRTANVKPMSGTTTVQQSATVTPWRGSDTPLASIRPISVQNSRTAAILPTSQQTSVGGSSANTSSSAASSNTALVPPQQQVHTTGTTSTEMLSSSPTSSHTDYMPSTSTALVAVAAIPPMGSAAASTVAESSQEAESVPQPQQNDPQPIMSGGQQQVVALVSPRVEPSSQNVPSPILQQQHDLNNPQPSTSASAAFISLIAVSSQSRHTPSSSNVTTSQAGSSIGNKRPRDSEANLFANNEDSTPETAGQLAKRMRAPGHTGELKVIMGVSDSGMEVEYQVPTSSQRDQEDDIVVVDSEEDDGVTEADDGQTEHDANDGYEDQYENEQDIDENDCPEINESNDNIDNEDTEAGNNEVEVDEDMVNQRECSLQEENQNEFYKQAAVSQTMQSQDNNQQSQTISSGTSEQSSSSPSVSWKQSTSSSLSRQQKPTSMFQHCVTSEGSEPSSNNSQQTEGYPKIDSSPQYDEIEDTNETDEIEGENVVEGNNEAQMQNVDENAALAVESVSTEAANEEGIDAEDFQEETTAGSNDLSETEIEAFGEDVNSGTVTPSDMQDIQPSQGDTTNESNDVADTVSSEGEKQAPEEHEEEGREAEASTSINTRSKTVRGGGVQLPRRGLRGYQRGSRPTPIIWQDQTGNSRTLASNSRNQDQINAARGFPNQRSQRARRMRRPGGNYNNIRFS